MTAPVVSLRAVEDDDLPIFLAHQSDPVAAAMAAFPIRAPRVFYDHWAIIRANPELISRTVLADGVVVGNIGSWVHEGEREIGYWIGRDHWGRGYATAALRLLLDEVADRPVFGHVAVDNVGSRRVLEHCGFTVVREAVAEDGIEERILRLD